SSETLALAATLLLAKSQKLLPKECVGDEALEDDPRMEMIQSLIEYCRVKEAAKTLAFKEEEQKAHFLRATFPLRKELGSGLEEVSIDGLKSILLDLLERTSDNPKTIIREEEWQISDKMIWFKQMLRYQEKMAFNDAFSQGKSRKELVVQ